MRLLIEISGPLKDWHAALNPQVDRPRLPLPFSVSAAFIRAGHDVSAISFTDDSFAARDRERFRKLYGPRDLDEALADNDIAFFWARSGIRAVQRDRSKERKVALASYVWQIKQGLHLRSRMLALATRAAARRARALVFMTDEQVSQASESMVADRPIVKFTWGIDSSFYSATGKPADLSDDISRLTREPYVILAGDQQRLDSHAVRLAAEFGLRIARVPQEPKTAAWYRSEISKQRLHNRLFVFEKVTYPTLRYLLQKAVCYIGMVDSTWQPAGWTVLCEAFASGTPAVVYEGLTSREMRRLGAGSFLATVRQGDVAGVAEACRQFAAANGRSTNAQSFARDVLDLEKTAPRFVSDIEKIVRPARLGNIKTLLAHPGTQHSFHLARELERLGALETFYTGVAWRPGGKLDRLMRFAPTQFARRLGNRRLQVPFQTRVERRTKIELTALWKTSLGHEEQGVMHERNQRFQESISDDALAAADVVVGVDTGSWILARTCRELRRPFVLDQSIGHPDAKQQMHERVRNQYPEWDEGFEARLSAVREAEISEQRDATAIVAASSFTKRTLLENGVTPDKVHVVPYGVDCRRFHLADDAKKRPFRFIFVGAVTARKGIPLLAEAWRKLNPSDAELWLVGPTPAKTRRLLSGIPRLHVKQAVPQREVPALLQQCDVFVFPSYFEGFGLVLLEAMACGLPVITTTATAGPDIVTSDRDGWMIEPGDVDALVDRLRTCLASRSQISDMGRAARQTAERFTWESYGRQWVALLRTLAGRPDNRQRDY
jgi:alpha-maltose-1-phosphate synthase